MRTRDVRDRLAVFLSALFGVALVLSAWETPTLDVMLLTGQSSQYHNWPVSSALLKRILEESGRFRVDIVRSPPRGERMSAFAPSFSKYRVVVLDYEGDEWSETTRDAFESFVAGGGGLVTFHASDNAFPGWPQFNEMIGVGGWGGRDEGAGSKVRWRNGAMVVDSSPGGAQHPALHDFLVVTRASGHPVMLGVPAEWLHAHDELYSQLRGPARKLEVLATASADPAKHAEGTGEHEPMLMTIRFGRGRIFHTTLGHVGPGDSEAVASLNCVGFITTFQRGTEWAATGTATLPIPHDFPTVTATSVRKP